MRENKNSKVKLVLANESNIPMLVKWIQDPLFSSTMATMPLLSTYDSVYDMAESWVNDSLKSPPQDLLMLIEKHNNEGDFVGFIKFNNIDWYSRHALFSCYLPDPDVDKGNLGGLGADVLLTGVEFAFNELNLERLYAHILETNHKSLKISSSFAHVLGEKKKQMYINGLFLSVVVLMIQRNDYLEKGRAYASFVSRYLDKRAGRKGNATGIEK